MCGRFVQLLEFEDFIEQFKLDQYLPFEIKPNPNVSPGDQAYIITYEKEPELKLSQFGLTPHWAKKPMYLINARAEGNYNKEDSRQYKGEMGITQKASFSEPIKSKRCLVLANGFIEGPTKEKLSKPYHIHKKNNKAFALAGIWDVWINKETGELVNSFSIITAASNEATDSIGHNRSPVIIDKKDQQKWLDHSRPVAEVLKLLKPYKGNDLEVDRISIKIKDPKNKNIDLLIPIEEQEEPKQTTLF